MADSDPSEPTPAVRPERLGAKALGDQLDASLAELRAMLGPAYDARLDTLETLIIQTIAAGWRERRTRPS
jgi:hypothetical protein